MTVYSNYTEDDLYESTCNLPINPPLHFKGRFIPQTPGLWYELFDYDTDNWNDIIDYQVVEFKNGRGEKESAQTLIRYSCPKGIGNEHFWTSEVWSRSKNVPQNVVEKLLAKFPEPISTNGSFHWNDNS